jgi:hypothetical protein
MRAGRIYLLAGDGAFGPSGDRGPAVKAALSPTSLAVDHHGNIVVADAADADIRLVAARSGRFYGQAMRAGDIYTIAGDGGLTYSGDGGPATKAAVTPWGVTVDAAGNIVVADLGSARIRIVAARPGRFYGQPMKAGHIYTIAGDGTGGNSGDGGPALRASVAPLSLALDAAGNVVMGSDVRVRVVAVTSGTFYGQPMTAGDIYTIAGGGARNPGSSGPALQAKLANPTGIAVTKSGTIYLIDTYRLYRISP